MKNNFYYQIFLLSSLLCSQYAAAAPIVNDFNTGDNLSAGKMTEIKNSVNDNNNRITQITNSGIDSSRITDDSITAADVDNSQIQLRVKLSSEPTCTTSSFISDISPNGTPSCGSDKNTIFSAGTGLTLTDTTFSITRKSFSLDMMSAFLNGSAAFIKDGFGANAGVFLPVTAQSSITFGFKLPLDYISGTLINADFTWSTIATLCDFELAPLNISVSRANTAFIQGSGSSGTSNGISGLTNNLLAAVATSSLPQSKRYIFTPPDSITAYKANDAIIFTLQRTPTNSEDTCADDLKIHGISISY